MFDKLVRLGIVFTMILVYASCEEKVEQNAPNHQYPPVLDPLTRDFTVFNVGSRWVYQTDTIRYRDTNCEAFEDSTTYFIYTDTIEISQIDSSISSFDGDRSLDVLTRSSLNYSDRNLRLYSKDTILFFTPLQQHQTRNNFFINGLDTGIIEVFTSSYDDTDTLKYYTLSLIDEMTVNHTTYHDIRKITVYYPKFNDPTRVFYWAKNVGLVKFYDRTPFDDRDIVETICGESYAWWALVDSDIQQ